MLFRSNRATAGDGQRQALARLEHQAAVNAVAFSPDGKTVATASGSITDNRDNTVRLREAASGKPLARLKHQGFGTGVAFSPDGKTLASGSWDSTARLWEVAGGKPLARLEHQDTVYAVAFSPDGSKLLVASGNSAQFYLYRADDLIRYACQTLPFNLTPAQWSNYLPDEPYRKTCPNLP